jgi:hypothetical protein
MYKSSSNIGSFDVYDGDQLLDLVGFEHHLRGDVPALSRHLVTHLVNPKKIGLFLFTDTRPQK